MMIPNPARHEIDHRTIKLTVGLIAGSLAFLTSVFAHAPLPSISASYYEPGWSQSIFIGFLFAIAALMLAYNGYTRREMILSKGASAAALAIALFPCECQTQQALVLDVHSAAAAVMFGILAYFCYSFFQRARAKGHPQARARAVVYVTCGLAIVTSMLVLAIDGLAHHALAAEIPRLTFHGETVSLVAFGISWLTASRVLPWLTREDERFWPLREHNPD